MTVAVKKINTAQKIISKIKEQNWIKLFIYVVMAYILGRGTLFGFMFPFVLSYFAAIIAVKKYYVFLSVPLLLGMASCHAPMHVMIKYAIILCILTGINFLLNRKLMKSSIFIALVVAGISLGTLAVYQAVTDTILLYDIFLMATETAAVFAFTYIFLRIPRLLESDDDSFNILTEDILCIATIIAIALSSLNSFQIYDIRIKYVVSLWLILTASYKGGFTVGAAVGVMMGLIIAMTNYEPQVIIGLFGIAGLVAGFFRNTYRILNCIAWTICLIIMSFYFNGLTETYVLLKEVAAASVVFLIIPIRWMDKMVDKIKTSIQYPFIYHNYSNKIRKMIIKDLTNYSNTFESLATTYGRAFERREAIGKGDVDHIVSKINSRICIQCDFNKICWKENNNKTKEVMKEIIYRADKGLKIETDYVKNNLGFLCEYLNQIIFFTQSIVQVYGTSYKWQKKLEGSREITASQFRCVSKSIDRMILEISKKQLFNKEFEKRIYHQVKYAKIPIKDISVIQKESGYEIVIEKNNKETNNTGTLENIITEVMGEPYTVVDESNNPYIKVFTKRPKYQVVTGASKYAKENNICGDSFAYISLKENEYMIALSDGMGAGEKAARESMMTINTLQHLLKAGFEKELALKTMNSMLLLKSTEEIFSTVDITTINLDSGNVSFFKIGAAAAFIKRSNNEVEVIKFSGLPIGIIDQIKIEEISTKMTPEDTIIMVSDGILDGYNGNEKVQWITGIIRDIHSKDPQTITDLILNKAIEQYGKEEKDDMTVIAAKIQ
ncbi:MAG: stage II sporulation protein E [Clostridia bacterium]|nr:stage II sporulation protein E [Clostridia bacterium]